MYNHERKARYKNFLKDIRDKVLRMDKETKDEMSKQLGVLSDFWSAYKEAEAKEEAKHLFVDPRSWFRFPPPTKLTVSEKHTRNYSLLAIVHDGYNWENRDMTEFIRKDLRQKGSITDAVWWLGNVKNEPRLQGLIEQALCYVEAKTGQKNTTTAESKKEKGGLSKKIIVVCSVVTLFVAILGLLFGDNIWGHIRNEFKSNKPVIEQIEIPKKENKITIEAKTSGDSSPAIITSPGSQVNINYYGPTVKDDDKANEPKYEFYFQPLKGKPENPDGSKNYEIGFKNLTTDPLVNFEFGLLFRNPVQNITYDFNRSSANFTGGEGLNHDKTKFHWMGNQIMGNGGWVVFIIKSKNPPNISKLNTRVVGRLVDSNKLILSDSGGLKQISESFEKLEEETIEAGDSQD